jgi:hypothetical protein
MTISKKYSKLTKNKNGSTSYETSEGGGQDKTVYIHKCSKEDVLDRMSRILVGNGHPEEGMAFQFKEFMKDHVRVLNDITEIKNKVTEAIDSSGKAIRAIETYKTETESFANGVKEKEEREAIAEALAARVKRDRWQRIFWIITAIIGVSGIWISVLFGVRNGNKAATREQVDNLGTPVITNSRGIIINLPEGDSIKYFREGQFVNFDTIKKDTTGRIVK